MRFWSKLKFWKAAVEPVAHAHGATGEHAAREFLRKKGLKFLTANFATKRGEIDLIFRDGDCLVFVEVKTRSSEAFVRPAHAVNAGKRRSLSRAASDYRRRLENPFVKYRFDVVEVLLEGGEVREIRHLERCFQETFRRQARLR